MNWSWLKTGPRRDVRGEVAMSQRLIKFDVATCGVTSPRGWQPTSRRDGQRRDVTEDCKNSRRDVAEKVKIDVATWKVHVAT